MRVLSAAYLLGLLALAVPVILHLIQRQRYPERRFTTLRFFDVTIKHNVIQRRLIDRLLLALRLLALLVLALALARPYWHGPVGQQRLALAVVLDNSPSMSRLDGPASLFDHARQAAGKLVSGLGPADRAAVLLTAPATDLDFTADRGALRTTLAVRTGQPTGLLVDGPQGRALSVPGLTTNLAALATALDRVPPGIRVALCGYGLSAEPQLDAASGVLTQRVARAALSACAGDLRGTVARAARLLQAAPEGDRVLVIYSDFQQSEWQGAPLGDLKGIRVLVANIAPPEHAGPNLAVEGCEVPERDVGLGQTVIGMASIRNLGTAPSSESKLWVNAGLLGKPAEVKVPAIPPGTTTRVAFPVPVMARDRDLLCTLRLESPEDPLPYDNEWHFQLGVRPPVTVLCVNGLADATGAARESYFVMSALGLPGALGRAETRVDVRECDLADVDAQPLFQYRVVVLAGVDRLSEAQRKKIGDFVTDGGGLLVFPGRDATPEEYNGWSFLPARVRERKADSFAFVRTISEESPLLAGLGERLGSSFYALTTRFWFLLAPDPGADVLAALGGDEPALVAATRGRGRVILAATDAHTSGSDWPLRPAFPVLLHALVRELGAPATPLPLVPERSVGAAAACRISPDLLAGTPAVFRVSERGGQTVYDEQPWYQSGASLVLPAAAQPGQYLLSVRPGAAPGLLDEPGVGASLAPVSVNHAAGESRLAAVPAAGVAALLPGAEMGTVPEKLDPVSFLQEQHRGREIWRILLVLALAVLVAESLIGWRAPSQSMG